MARQNLDDIPVHRLRAFVDGRHDQLLPGEQEVLSRLSFAYDQLKYESAKTTAARLQQKFGISVRQAFYDIQRCKTLFNPIFKADIDWLENFILEDAKCQMVSAKAEGNHSAWMGARTHLLKMYAMLKANDTGFDIDKMGNNNYYVVVASDNKAIKLDLDKVHELPINERVELSHSILLREIDAEEAELIMNDK